MSRHNVFSNLMIFLSIVNIETFATETLRYEQLSKSMIEIFSEQAQSYRYTHCWAKINFENVPA